MARAITRLALTAITGLLLWAQPAASQRYEEDTPVPADAKGEVLPLKGDVLPLKGEVLEIRGIASGLAARVDPVQAALRDLGASVKDKEIKINLSADVLFDFDKADLRPEATPALANVAQVLGAHPRATTLIEGHTDAKGTDKYNQPLSERRAEAVRRWLVANGVAATITTRGWGKMKPVAPNTKANGADNPEGRQKNRRVEITVRTQ
jgi:outer membrane protein OmpA-like peptidoglycan-associated protein